MTVSSATNRVTFAGDDATTSFDTTPIVFFAISDLLVYVTTDATGATELLVEGTGYTVSGGDESVGAVGAVSLAGGSAPHGALLTGTTLVILRELPLTQTADFVQNDASNAEVVEATLDKLAMTAQRFEEKLERSVKLPDSDVTGESMELPVLSSRASKVLGFDAGGGIAMYDAGSAVTTSDNVTFVQSGSGSSARTVAAKLQDIVCIKDFGADASGTAAANTTAIEAAQTACVAAGAALFVNRGRYEHSGLTFDATWSGMMAFGEGVNESMLEYNGTGKAVQILGTSGGYVNHFTWKDIGLVTDNTAQETGQHHLYLQYVADSEFHNVYTSYAGDTGLYLDGAVDRCRFFGAYIERSQTQALKLATSISGGSGARSNANKFFGTSMWNNVAGIVIDNGCYANVFTATSIENANAPYTGTALTITSGTRNIFNGLYIEMQEDASSLVTGISMAATNSRQNVVNGLLFGVQGVSSGAGVTVISDSGIANEFRSIGTADSTLAVQGTFTRFSLGSGADGTIIDGANNNGLSTPVDSINIGSTARIYASEKFRYVETVVAKTSDYEITGADSGYIFTNNGAGGVVTFTLPSTTGLASGFTVTFMRNNATHDLRIDLDDASEIIRGGGGGKYLSLDTQGACVSLVYTSASTVWDIKHTNGTTSFEA